MAGRNSLHCKDIFVAMTIEESTDVFQQRCFIIGLIYRGIGLSGRSWNDVGLQAVA